ncbi:hypothetical protein, partial [Burkholderia multivorans]|uniref:hypothetical protein n=1 Tax=Burkholderia multivorans TaxID=87883 RepID=UPI001F15A47B
PTALRLGQNFDAFHVMTRLTDRHKTIPYFKRVLVSSDTWGHSTHRATAALFAIKLRSSLLSDAARAIPPFARPVALATV